jgi:hypothetical protein
MLHPGFEPLNVHTLPLQTPLGSPFLPNGRVFFSVRNAVDGESSMGTDLTGLVATREFQQMRGRWMVN